MFTYIFFFVIIFFMENNKFKICKTTKNEEETIALGQKIASLLKKGYILSIKGDMAMGKTRIARGFCRHFALEKDFSSPTYALINEYKKEGLTIYHMDAYRIENIDELDYIGFYECMEDEDAFMVIEWGDMIKEVFDEKVLFVNIQGDLHDLNKRNITITSYNKEIIDKLKEII